MANLGIAWQGSVFSGARLWRIAGFKVGQVASDHRLHAVTGPRESPLHGMDHDRARFGPEYEHAGNPEWRHPRQAHFSSQPCDQQDPADILGDPLQLVE